MNILTNIFAVALGGALGASCRYLIALASERFSVSFPIATFCANIIGCLLIGLLWALLEKVEVSHAFKLFLLTGFLGGLTTFSTYARESYSLLEMGDYFHGSLYILLSNVLGLLMVALGFYLSHRFLLR